MGSSSIFLSQFIIIFSGLVMIAGTVLAISRLDESKIHVISIFIGIVGSALFIPMGLSIFDTNLDIGARPGSTEFGLVNRTHPNILQKLNLVEFDDIPVLVDLYMKYTSGTGYYSGVTKEIYISPNFASNIDTYWHEIGHHVWYHLLTEEEKDSFEELHKKDQEVLPGCWTCYDGGSHLDYCDVGFPTSYAYSKLEEDWAESFEWFVMSNEYYSHKEWVEGPGEERVEIISNSLERITGCGEPRCVRKDGY